MVLAWLSMLGGFVVVVAGRHAGGRPAGGCPSGQTKQVWRETLRSKSESSRGGVVLLVAQTIRLAQEVGNRDGEGRGGESANSFRHRPCARLDS